MGHRALVGYRRPDGRYDVRYSHWGGRQRTLVDAIGPETPLAGGSVAPDPLAASVGRDRLLTHYLDPCTYEALYLVVPADRYAVTPYRVLWLEFPDGRDGGRGAIVERPPSAARTLEAWLRAAKTTLADVVEMGVLSRPAARSYLEARVCEEHDGVVYTHRGESSE